MTRHVTRGCNFTLKGYTGWKRSYNPAYDLCFFSEGVRLTSMLLASVSVGDFAFESDADSHWKPVVPKLNYDLRRLSLIYSQMFEALKKSA